MSSVFLVALASGAMGAITAVATADPSMRSSVRSELSEREENIMDVCEKCADYINENDLRIDESLKSSRMIQVCEKIGNMNGPRLREILIKMLKNPKIKIDKLQALSELCEGDDGELCQAVKEVVGKEQLPRLEAGGRPSVEEIARESAKQVSRDYRNIKLTPSKDVWMSAEDFDWSEDDRVEEGMSMYPVRSA